jgi:uncharacterized protein DUF998
MFTSSKLGSVSIPAQESPINKLTIKTMLSCGLSSSILYVAANILTAILYEGYSAASQTVSELSAIGAPTRSLWVSLMIVHSLLSVAFTWGAWQSAPKGNKLLKTAAILFFVNTIVGLFWPPMHQREVLAAGGGTLTDTLHIVFTIVFVFINIVAISFVAAAFGKGFRLYSIATLVSMLLFGALTGMDSPQMEANLPTPWIGIWERISIGAYVLWMAVLSVMLMRRWR